MAIINKKLVDGIRPKDVRGTPPNKYRVDGSTPDLRKASFKITNKRSQVILLRDIAFDFVGIKVAVGAFKNAPRQVDVET